MGKQVGHAIGKRAGFAGACAGEDEERARFRGDRGKLFIVELGSEVDGRDAGLGQGVVRGKIHGGGSRSRSFGRLAGKRKAESWQKELPEQNEGLPARAPPDHG